MNIEDVQPWMATLLGAYAPLAGVAVLQDDGTYPKTPGREEALSTQGLCLTVWQIESDGLLDDAPKGAAVEVLRLAVVLEENPQVCRKAGGADIRIEKALRLVREALVGKRHPTEPGTVLRCADPPFKNFGNVNGVQRIVMLLALDLPIVPS